MVTVSRQCCYCGGYTAPNDLNVSGFQYRTNLWRHGFAPFRGTRCVILDFSIVGDLNGAFGVSRPFPMSHHLVPFGDVCAGGALGPNQKPSDGA